MNTNLNSLYHYSKNIEHYIFQRIKVGLGFINHRRLFNAKSSLYTYIKYIRFGLVWFYGISVVVGYLMPKSLYTYILDIWDLVWLGFMAYQPLSVI